MKFLKSITPKGWLAIALVILIIFLIIKANKKQTITTTTVAPIVPPAQGGGNSSTTSTPSSTGDSFPLHFGSRGDNVKTWQTYLNSKGSTLKVDGIWGVLTEAASIKQTGFNSINKDYFDLVTKAQ